MNHPQQQPDGDDLHHMLGWNERLPLLAQAQFRYLDQLKELGFDAEQAFTLVRDWSQHAWAWSVQPPPVAGVDPSTAPAHESYLMELPGEGEPTGGAHADGGPDLVGDDDDRHHRDGDGDGGGDSIWSDGSASPQAWPGEDEISRARRQRRRRWGFRGDDRMDDAA